MKRLVVILLALILLSDCVSAPPQASEPVTEAPTPTITKPPQGNMPSDGETVSFTTEKNTDIKTNIDKGEQKIS